MIILLTASGCWDALDIEDREICTAVVLTKEKDDLVFYIEVESIFSKLKNPQSEQGSTQKSSTAIVKGGGKSFTEARINLDKQLNKKLYLGAVQALIITDVMAEDGIEEYANRVRQMVDYRKTMDVLVTTDKPEDFLGVQPENASAVGFAVESIMESLVLHGSTYHMSLADLLQKLASKNPSYVINTLAVENGQVTLIGNTVFEGGKSIGFISFEESRGLVYLGDGETHTSKFDYLIALAEDKISMETTLKKKKIKASYDGKKISFNINLDFEAMPLYLTSQKPITTKIKSELEKKLKQELLSDIEKSIDQTKKYCDFLSFSEYFRISYPDDYEKLNWKDAFKEAEFKTNINVEILDNETIDYNPKNE